MSRHFGIALAFAALVLAPGLAAAQKVVQLKNQPPQGANVTFQMTDGTVLAQSYNDNTWYKLTPDNTGSYVNGTWTQVASLQPGYSPLYFAGAVLADGRLVISGGLNTGRCADDFQPAQGAVYDPLTNIWTVLKPPKGWKWIGDSPSSVLPDGRFMVGDKFFNKVAALDPKTMKWTELTSKGKNEKWFAEEGFVLMPTGDILTWDVKGNPASEMYDVASGKWENLGNTPEVLAGPCLECQCIEVPPKNWCYYSPGETGPGILRPDGTVFAMGATPEGQNTAHTAIYTPGKGWSAGPDWPDDDQASDSPAALLPDGNVLALGSNTDNLYEFDGKNFTRENVGEVNATYSSLMVLPTGEVLIAGYAVYQPTGTYKPAWQPTISDAPSSVTRGSTYKITGTQFNGLSQAAGFGDEVETWTNYPLVRITNNSTNHVFYARTHDHSTMGVATGKKKVFTNFDVPTGMETGASTLEVVANGIPSAPVAVTVQ